jgi:large subunit ribosomal protein L31e
MSKQEEKLERIYTVPLSRAWITARHKRTKRAVRVLREFAEQHMKSSEIKIDTQLNERLWNRGITRPPRKITVKMVKDEDGVITISLPKVEKPSGALAEEGRAGEKALPEAKQQSLPEGQEAALPPAAEEKKSEEPAPKVQEKKKPAKKKAPSKKPASKTKKKAETKD